MNSKDSPTVTYINYFTQIEYFSIKSIIFLESSGVHKQKLPSMNYELFTKAFYLICTNMYSWTSRIRLLNVLRRAMDVHRPVTWDIVLVTWDVICCIHKYKFGFFFIQFATLTWWYHRQNGNLRVAIDPLKVSYTFGCAVSNTCDVNGIKRKVPHLKFVS